MKEIIGNKVKKYYIFQCAQCNESYEVDAKDLLGEADKLICPWCEAELNVHIPSIAKMHEFRIVRVD